MKLNYIKSQSSVYPDLVDATSSKKVVYLRQNIEEVTIADEESGEDITYYEYDEVKLTKEEYEKYLEELSATETLENIENLKAENQMLTEQIEMLDETLAIMLEEILPSLMGE